MRRNGIMTEKLSVVGKRHPKLDAPLKATGRSRFTDDEVLPGMLYGKIVRSTIPRGKILNIDTSEAESLPGVVAVITHKDTDGIRVGTDQDLLCNRMVNYVGDEVAAVAAIDEGTAYEAARLVKVDYEPLPALFSIEEAMAQDSPLLHPEHKVNCAADREMVYGDLDKAFSDSDYVRSDEFTTYPSHNCFAEMHTTLVDYSLPGKLTMWTPSQSAVLFQKDMAQALGITQSNVRVCFLNTGGAFSGRYVMRTHHLIAAVLSRKATRPVKITATSDEEFIMCRSAGKNRLIFKSGVMKDGTLKVITADHVYDCGAYIEKQGMILGIVGTLTQMLYKVEAFRYRGRLVYTNNVPYFFHHGGGLVPSQFALGQHLYQVARDLNMDPADLQLKNGVEKGYVTPNDVYYASCGLKQCIKKAVRKSGWKKKYGKLPPYRGIGIGCGVMASGAKGIFPHDTSAAFIKIGEDGKISLFTGLPDMGQGSHTTMAIIAAETLGISLDDITVVSGDTDITPFDGGAFGQRGTFNTGNAVKIACRDAKKQIAKTASNKLGVKGSSLVFRDRKIYPKGEPDKAVSFQDVVFETLNSMEGRYIMGRGFYNSPKQQPAMAFSFGAQIAEVEVDPDTGTVKLLKMTVAHDVGRAINPLAVEGQMDGQVFSGMGQTLFEESYVERGRILNQSRIDYKLPRPFEVPEMDYTIVETHDPYGPFGAKEVGEGIIACNPQAIANAVSHAMGYTIKEFPITPERLLPIIRKKEKT